MRSVTVANLISGYVTTQYNEGSQDVIAGDVVLAAPSRLRGAINLSTATAKTASIASGMDTSDSNMDTANSGTAATGVGAIASVVANAASLTLVKAERPDHLAGTSTSPATVTPVATGPIGTGSSSLFAGIANSNKTARSDDWLATNSPGSPQNSLQSQHVVYSTSQQQLSEQQQSSMAHSSPLAHQQVSNNGYASPMSTGSYDPYSPNGKIGK